MRQSRDKVCFISNKKIKIYDKPIFIIIKENLPEMLLARLHLLSNMERVNVIGINIHRQQRRNKTLHRDEELFSLIGNSFEGS